MVHCALLLLLLPLQLNSAVPCALRRNIYAALAVYRIAPPSSWPVTELTTQINISRETTRRDLRSLGNILFTANYFRDNTRGVRDVFQSKVYTQNASTPSVGHWVKPMNGVSNDLLWTRRCEIKRPATTCGPPDQFEIFDLSLSGGYSVTYVPKFDQSKLCYSIHYKKRIWRKDAVLEALFSNINAYAQSINLRLLVACQNASQQLTTVIHVALVQESCA